LGEAPQAKKVCGNGFGTGMEWSAPSLGEASQVWQVFQAGPNRRVKPTKHGQRSKGNIAELERNSPYLIANGERMSNRDDVGTTTALIVDASVGPSRRLSAVKRRGNRRADF
jgi:hypothetical protein